MILVSVIVPCFNEPQARLDATIKAAILAGADDIVVVDDGSEIPVVVSAPPCVSLCRKEHGGIASALNLGVRRARHERIAPCAVGDYFLVNGLTAHMDIAGPSFGSWQDALTGEINHPRKDWHRQIVHDNQFSMGTAMFSIQEYYSVGGFDETLVHSVDWSFALRISEHVGWTMIDDVLMVGAEYPGGHTARANAERRALDNAIVSRMARRYDLDRRIGKSHRMAVSA